MRYVTRKQKKVVVDLSAIISVGKPFMFAIWMFLKRPEKAVECIKVNVRVAIAINEATGVYGVRVIVVHRRFTEDSVDRLLSYLRVRPTDIIKMKKEVDITRFMIEEGIEIRYRKSSEIV